MKQNLFNAVNFRASWLPDGCAKDLPGECERYEAVIAEHGPIDLQLLGIGHNGHIGWGTGARPIGDVSPGWPAQTRHWPDPCCSPRWNRL